MIESLPDLWAMETRELSGLLDRLNAHYKSDAGKTAILDFNSAAAKMDVIDGVAHIDIKGKLLERVPWIFSALGFEATSYSDIREQVAYSLNSEDIKSIQLNIDSGGGSVQGAFETSSFIREATKPVSANLEGVCASAAYLIASQADEVVCGPSSLVGSIGVCSIQHDHSKQFKKDGIATHVIASSPLKGAGAMGAEITEEQLADIQRNVDYFADLFTADIAKGRQIEIEEAKKLSTGQLWVGQEAVDKGLADEVIGLQPEIDNQKQEIEPKQKQAQAKTSAQEQSMTEEKNAELLAELESLREQNSKLHEENIGLKVSAEEAQLQALAADEQSRKAIIAQHSDRITPAMLEHVEAFGATHGAEKLEGFCKSLPRVVRDEPIGETSEQKTEAETKKLELNKEDQDVCDFLGLSAEDFVKYGNQEVIS